MIKALQALPGLEELACRFGESWSDYSFLAQLPKLHTVRIILPFGGSPITVETPPGLQRIVLASRGSRMDADQGATGAIDAWLRTKPGSHKTLAIVGLDATRVLAHLSISFVADHLVISGDDRLPDLRNLTLPESAAALTIDNCRRFTSLASIEALELPALRALAIERVHRAPFDVDGLFVGRPGCVPTAMIEQLDFVHVGGIAISDLVHQLGVTPFNLSTSYGNEATWTRGK